MKVPNACRCFEQLRGGQWRPIAALTSGHQDAAIQQQRSRVMMAGIGEWACRRPHFICLRLRERERTEGKRSAARPIRALSFHGDSAKPGPARMSLGFGFTSSAPKPRSAATGRNGTAIAVAAQCRRIWL
jgi:hypothetical protein